LPGRDKRAARRLRRCCSCCRGVIALVTLARLHVYNVKVIEGEVLHAEERGVVLIC
jgi:hypothetical protein